MKRTVIKDGEVCLAIVAWFKESGNKASYAALYDQMRKLGYACPTNKTKEILCGLDLMNYITIQKRGGIKIVNKRFNSQDYSTLKTVIKIHRRDKDVSWMELMSRLAVKDGRINNHRTTEQSKDLSDKFLIISNNESFYCEMFEYIDGILEYKHNGKVSMIETNHIKIYGI